MTRVAGLQVSATPIEGLLVVDLEVHADSRGWFKENWQRAKMVELGVPDFGPVQNNMSFNTTAGATRGIHAEPWDKFVSLARGRIFGAWVDLRPGPGFGTVFTLEMGVETAVFVPRGVGNAYQTLEDETAYSYLVNDHWSLAAKKSYTFVNLADETLAIDWPIPLEQAEVSEADKAHPRLPAVVPMPHRQVLVIGAGGQLGRALVAALPDAVAVGRESLDLSNPESVARFDFAPYGVVINAAAYTKVDAAETPDGRRAAWAVNVAGVGALVSAARAHRLTLVHVSSDYVFDGTVGGPYRGRAVLTARGLRPDQGRRRRAGGLADPPLHPAHQLGGRRRPQLRPHHGRAGRPGRAARSRRGPVRPAHLHHRAGPGGAAPAGRRPRRSAPTT